MKAKFAVLTSGGDAPGMNAAIRSIVRMAGAHGRRTLGIRRGYQGLLSLDALYLDSGEIGKILDRGGTVLHTARCLAMHTPEGVKKAVAALEALEVDTLVAIGGDGTMRGCQALAQHWRGRILGLPGTIDNDLWGTDTTIGFDTAVNTALNAIEKIRDTADSHERIFLVEVMGRHCGAIALEVALACGAEDFLIPEKPCDLNALRHKLRGGKDGQAGSMLVVAEGAFPGGVRALAQELGKDIDDACRLCVLGHVQRGGPPTAADRLLATRLGAYAVEAALSGETGKLVGESAGRPVLVDFAMTCNLKKSLDPWILRMAPILCGTPPRLKAPRKRCHKREPTQTERT